MIRKYEPKFWVQEKEKREDLFSSLVSPGLKIQIPSPMRKKEQVMMVVNQPKQDVKVSIKDEIKKEIKDEVKEVQQVKQERGKDQMKEVKEAKHVRIQQEKKQEAEKVEQQTKQKKERKRSKSKQKKASRVFAYQKNLQQLDQLISSGRHITLIK